MRSGATRADAEQRIFECLHIGSEGLEWCDDGCVIVSNNKSGFNEEGDWFNILVCFSNTSPRVDSFWCNLCVGLRPSLHMLATFNFISIGPISRCRWRSCNEVHATACQAQLCVI